MYSVRLFVKYCVNSLLENPSESIYVFNVSIKAESGKDMSELLETYECRVSVRTSRG